MAPLPAKIVLGDAVLHFANNGAELSPEGITAVEAVAQQLKAYPGEYSLVVGGHTSSVGSKAHNKALSLRRAQSVAKVLIDAGLPAAKVATEGFGPDKPVADNKTREGQSRNRRVEIDVKTADTVEKIHTEYGSRGGSRAGQGPCQSEQASFQAQGLSWSVLRGPLTHPDPDASGRVHPTPQCHPRGIPRLAASVRGSIGFEVLFW